ncbi:Thyrotropin-releasing hormone receptor [Hypsibius exemplaris]|uniref:Thyrotropin-releasing hormone receptor n=1 Tax=Hypsibius exemplaris TaxID=2072580 RepID=A0A1W0WXF3_HYPEX|nr:Thyrotropin-releasing hormone receptor [Hypsibius exemplaris]
MDVIFNETVRLMGNATAGRRLTRPGSFPWDYRIVATVLQSLIFLLGFCGNILLIIVVKRTRALHTPTYCYLVSLAFADLMVLVSAVPEAIMSNHLYFRQWVLGQVGCSVLIFGNFLGINAGSLSIITFSIERYIAVRHTMLAQRICTVARAKLISLCVWAFCILYCSPWLGLTLVKPHPRDPRLEVCDFRVSHQQYVYYFTIDITLFYFIPLILSVYLYTRIAQVLRSRNQLKGLTEAVPINRVKDSQTSITSPNGRKLGWQEPTAKGAAANVVVRMEDVSVSGIWKQRFSSMTSSRHKSRMNENANTQAIQMLVMVVFLFAISWLPFRGVLLYNTFAARPWLNSWYMMFAKCAIYINCGINPLLYNAMNRRFRAAFLEVLRCDLARRPLQETTLSVAETTAI